MASIKAMAEQADALFARDGGLHPPSEVILNWPKPNYVNPVERGWEAPIFIIVVTIITFLVYIARMWARLVVAKNAGWDDLIMSIAMLPLIGLVISVVLALKVYGFQWHTWDQTSKTIITTREITMSIEINYLIATTLIKISILLFYRRITGTLSHTFIYWVWGSIIFCVLYGIIFTLLISFTCTPVVGYFHIYDLMWRLKNELQCHDEGAIVIACAIISTVQDLVICALPVFLIWNLQIARRQKVALCGIFALGLVTCVCGIMRTYYATDTYYYTYDITWNAYPGWVWTALEAQLAVICASAAARSIATYTVNFFLLVNTTDCAVNIVKIFFRRYFGAVTERLGYSGSESRQNDRNPRSRGYGKMSHQQSSNLASMSHVGHGQSNVPLKSLDGIRIDQQLDVHVEERDNMSQTSDASTKNLTALPDKSAASKHDWVGSCKTFCAAATKNKGDEKDLEKGV